MTLGALVDIGVEPRWLEGLPSRLGYSDVSVRIARVARCGISATKVDFAIPVSAGSNHGTHVGDLIEVVRRAPVSERVRAQAVRAFELVGDAEARVHDVAADRVHLHEVGAVDAVLDVIGAIEGFERLRLDAVYHLPVAVGNGWVTTAHGALPVPAPATAHLLEGLEVRSDGPVEGEATTPTGAALLRVLSRGAPPAGWRVVRSGWGAGGRDPARYPNALRIFLAETAVEAGVVEVVVTDVDDLQPEYVEPLRQALLDAGALDCVTWPTQAKKGRVGLRLEALAPAAAMDRVITALFANSTSAGVRRWSTARVTLRREEMVVELAPGARVRIKVWEAPGGRRMKAEYEDVLAAARALGRPALEVAREAERRAEADVAGDRSR
jgi:uncharacterized protein (TIGR00299 family) protein